MHAYIYIYIYIYTEREREITIISLSLSNIYIYVCIYIYIYIFIYVCTHIIVLDGWSNVSGRRHVHAHRARHLGGRLALATVSSQTKNLDFGGVGSNMFLSLLGGIPRSVGRFPDI